MEAAAAKREDALSRRLQLAERELDDLRTSCVPDAQLRKVREEAREEREQMQNALTKQREEARRQDEHYK